MTPGAKPESRMTMQQKFQRAQSHLRELRRQEPEREFRIRFSRRLNDYFIDG